MKNTFKKPAKIKIGLIARSLTKGGVTRVVTNILAEFNNYSKPGFEFVLFTDREDFIEKYPNIKVIFRKNIIHKLYWSYFQILPDLWREKCDVIIYPKHIISPTHYLFRFKKYVIVHDLAYFHNQFLEYKLLDTIYMRMLMPLSCRKADKLLAVSEATKKDIEHKFHIKPEKITVINEGVEDSFFSGSVSRNHIEGLPTQQPYLFYCGSLSPRKNILRVLMAFEQLKDIIPHNFLITGSQSWNDSNVRKYIHQKLADRVFLIGYKSELELRALYKYSSLFLYPSLYEGFGLPILEAQACGCPVLTSNVTSCPETAGQGAHIVNPYSIDEIRDGIMKIISDTAYRNQLVELGKKNVERYSWNKVAENILRTIQRH